MSGSSQSRNGSRRGSSAASATRRGSTSRGWIAAPTQRRWSAPSRGEGASDARRLTANLSHRFLTSAYLQEVKLSGIRKSPAGIGPAGERKTETDMTGNAFFADFEDDLNAGSRAPKAAPEVFVERCPKCGGSGRFGTYRSLGPCYSCKGTGKVEYRTSMVQRQKSRASTARTKVNKAEAWAAAHPAEVAWLASARGEFAASLNEALGKYGFLTERQLAAVTRCIERDAERKVERVAREAAAPTTDASRIEEAFQAALAHQVARPKLRLDTFVFSLASASGKNAGAIY